MQQINSFSTYDRVTTWLLHCSSCTGCRSTTGSLTKYVLECTSCILSVRRSICLIAFRQSRVTAVDLVSDPPAQLSTPSRVAEPSSESAASLMLDLLHGTVFHTISNIFVTLVFSSAASKLNYFVEHMSLVVSSPGRSVNSAIEMTVLLLLLLLLLRPRLSSFGSETRLKPRHLEAKTETFIEYVYWVFGHNLCCFSLMEMFYIALAFYKFIIWPVF